MDSNPTNSTRSVETVKDTLDSIPKKAGIDTAFFHLQMEAKASYSITKASIASDRMQLWIEYQRAESDSGRKRVLQKASDLLETSLINQVFPFWYGTPWSFEGHTNSPRKGEVACGYFVSTTLKHIGFNLNRYRLAQQNPQNEALSINLSDSLIQFDNITVTELRQTLLTDFADGLYFVGLESHVGYLLIRNGEVFFIHSNYIGDGGVAVELALESAAFPSSTYYIASISTNPALMINWLNNTQIEVKMSD